MDFITCAMDNDMNEVDRESVLDCVGDHMCDLDDLELREYWRALSFEEARDLLREEFTFEYYGM